MKVSELIALLQGMPLDAEVERAERVCDVNGYSSLESTEVECLCPPDDKAAPFYSKAVVIR